MPTVDTRAPQVSINLQHGDPWTLNVTSADAVPSTLEVWIALRQSASTPLLGRGWMAWRTRTLIAVADSRPTRWPSMTAAH